jgi:hypothetical protein
LETVAGEILEARARRLAAKPERATVWGETRLSPLHEVSFERASDVPMAQGMIFYDDHTLDGARYDEAPSYAGLETQIVDDRGRPFETLWAGGQFHVEGSEGQRYSLLVRNRTGQRVEVVASVDGLDVVDGRRASLAKRGYLVDRYATLTIDGFRRNHREVAAFRFGSVADSYAARTGSDRNVGVICFAFFDERGARVHYDDERERRRDARPFSEGRFAQPPPPYNTAP